VHAILWACCRGCDSCLTDQVLLDAPCMRLCEFGALRNFSFDLRFTARHSAPTATGRYSAEVQDVRSGVRDEGSGNELPLRRRSIHLPVPVLAIGFRALSPAARHQLRDRSRCGVHAPDRLKLVSGSAVLAMAVPSWPHASGRFAQHAANFARGAVIAALLAFGGGAMARRWVQVSAGAKFRSRAALYLTIPAIAGILNWATNQLAVWMIFNPLEFKGIPVISRPRVGEPLGWGGWQGIVPAKVMQCFDNGMYY